ncbi:LOW QUALITY PROTEIN: defensin-like protein 50 [Capsella rubella]|uniref:LOW QUALITY PROTEIN: defensin-like protein 50 n=1 Tax=Capsella rubella TaxID=81985 RepID=UPI000CD5A007|nr:LOW QUALITY PROTEIN: defensin-like protein 50 [Capsella rubella]
MGYTKILVPLFLVAILVVSMSPQNAMASEIKAIKEQKCTVPCTPSYENLRCSVDCITLGFSTGGCRIFFPHQPLYCCCFKLT